MGGIPGLLPDIPEHGQVLSSDGVILNIQHLN